MNNLLSHLLILFFVIFCVFQLKSENVDVSYTYGFILPCGKTIYRTFSHSLTDNELLYWSSYYEEISCGGNDIEE